SGRGAPAGVPTRGRRGAHRSGRAPGHGRRRRRRRHLPSRPRPRPRYLTRAGMTGSKRRLGVVGTFVWDVIYGRDARAVPIEEWGGITYALAGLDAALPDDWEIVPLIKVGSDLGARAQAFFRSLRHAA